MVKINNGYYENRKCLNGTIRMYNIIIYHNSVFHWNTPRMRRIAGLACFSVLRT